MKKTVLMLTIMILLLCTACGKTETDHDAFFDTFLLTDMRVDGVSVPAVFNPAKGTMTPLCTDPLCAHTKDAGCPFGGYNKVGDIHYHNNAIYYLSGKQSLLDSDIIRYDMESGKVDSIVSLTELAEYVPADIKSGNGIGHGFIDGYFRYIIRNADFTTAFQLRVDLDNGKVEVLDKNYRYPTAKYDGITLTTTPEMDYTGVSYGFIKTDDKGNIETILADRRIQITFDDLLSDGKLIYTDCYQREDGKYDLERQRLWMYDFKTGEDRLIMEEFPDVYIAMHGDYIYHVKDVENPPVLGVDMNSEGKERFNTSGGILWRTNIYTGECEIAFEMPAYTLAGTQTDRVGQYIVIGYHNVDYKNYTIEEYVRHNIVETWYEYPEEIGRIVYDTETGTTAVYPDAST